MVTHAKNNDIKFLEESNCEFYDQDSFEKIRRRSPLNMPSRKARTARRAACRAKASRKNSSKNSVSHGGKHLRRKRAVWHA